jgi:hypothetical protein
MGGDAEEVGAALPAHALLINESYIDFVDERSGLEGVIGPLPSETASGNAAKLIVDNRY